MTYNKPEVVKLDCAVKAIQGVNKPVNATHFDISTLQNTATVGAYEADE